MQLGPATPPNSTDQIPAASIDSSEAQQEHALSVDPGTTQDQTDSGELTQESGSESFFETWAKGQDMPMAPSMLFLAGVVLAFLIIMRSLMKSSAKRKQQTRTMGNPTQRIDKLNNRAKGSMDPARQAMVDAEDLTRRLGAVLDNKATRIELLLEEASQRIAQLELANRTLQQTAQLSAQSAEQHQTSQPAPQPTAQPTTQSAHQPAPPPTHQSPQDTRGMTPEALDRARLDQDRAERTWVETNQPKTPEESEPIFRIDRGINAKPREESPHPLTFPEQVDELATQGLNALEIANKLNRLVGEVELVLNLRRNSG